jgi:hypothetical protein
MAEDTTNKAPADELVDQVTKKYGAAVGQVLTIYLPQIKRLDAGGLLDLSHTLAQPNQTAEALDQLHRLMTGEELAAEKHELTSLLEAMTQSNTAKWDAANQLVTKALNLGITALIGVV